MTDNQQNGRDLSPDEVTQQHAHKVRDAVKNIQSREAELSSPVPKPRRFSPAPSPTTARKIPERVKLQGVTVTPPSSPMRRRSEGFKNGVGDNRPKPPVRKRRKKFATDDNDGVGTNRNSAEVGINRHSMDPSDYVNLSFSAGNMDFAREGEKREGETTTVPQNDHAADGEEGERGGGGGGGGGEEERQGVRTKRRGRKRRKERDLNRL